MIIDVKQVIAEVQRITLPHEFAAHQEKIICDTRYMCGLVSISPEVYLRNYELFLEVNFDRSAMLEDLTEIFSAGKNVSLAYSLELNQIDCFVRRSIHIALKNLQYV